MIIFQKRKGDGKPRCQAWGWTELGCQIAKTNQGASSM